MRPFLIRSDPADACGMPGALPRGRQGIPCARRERRPGTVRMQPCPLSRALRPLSRQRQTSRMLSRQHFGQRRCPRAPSGSERRGYGIDAETVMSAEAHAALLCERGTTTKNTAFRGDPRPQPRNRRKPPDGHPEPESGTAFCGSERLKGCANNTSRWLDMGVVCAGGGGWGGGNGPLPPSSPAVARATVQVARIVRATWLVLFRHPAWHAQHCYSHSQFFGQSCTAHHEKR